MSAVGRRSEGLQQRDFGELDGFSNSDHFTTLEKAVLQYATEMSSTPARISDDNFEVLKAEFSHKQLVELTSCIAWENFRSRFNHAFGVDSAKFDVN